MILRFVFSCVFWTAIGLDLQNLTAWLKSRGCPLNPQKVRLFAKGLAATKFRGHDIDCLWGVKVRNWWVVPLQPTTEWW